MPTFSEVFLSYLAADPETPEEIQQLAILVMFERKPGQWVGGMRQELESFSSDQVAPVLRTDAAEIPADIRARVERKWILLANVLRNPWRLVNTERPNDPRFVRLLAPRYEEARLLLLAAYSFVRGVEGASEKWWHKGSLCWFLADSHVEANELDEALTYFLLALIEDAWSFQRAKALTTAQRPEALPAFIGLSTVAAEQANHLLARCVEVTKSRKKWSSCEPELSYLKTICRLDYFATSRGPLPFSAKTAETFLRVADKARTTAAKGEAYELLLAYLFESTEGFQAVLNAIARDQENDLLVVNRRSDIPLRCLGEFLICQCKNTQEAAGAALIREFAGRLLEAGCESGIFLCKSGISGEGGDPAFPRDAVSTRMKARQREGMNILTLEREDLVAVCRGAPRFDTFLSDEYVRVRFDLLRGDETKHGRRKVVAEKNAGKISVNTKTKRTAKKKGGATKSVSNKTGQAKKKGATRKARAARPKGAAKKQGGARKKTASKKIGAKKKG